MWYAHYQEEGAGIREQTVLQHALGVSARAMQTLASVGLPATGRVLGALHDMGKSKQEFQDYLFSSNGRRGEVDHASIGAIWGYCALSELPDAGARRAAELVGYAIACHHGLQDCIDPMGKNVLRGRMEKDKRALCYDEAVENFFAEMPIEQIKAQLPAVVQEIDALCARVNNDAFLIGLAARLMLSALIDADWQDSASFYEGAERASYESSRAQWDRMIAALQERLTALGADAERGDAHIRQVRKRLSDGCAQAAEREKGIYTLSLPTGAGKTLSSLHFALRHARKHGARHIFYIAPLLTILDQNAKEIVQAVQDETAVLEHTSDMVASFERRGAAQEAIEQYERLTERWDAPIVVTSLVQFLNTLFAQPQACIRRLQSLIDSVILIDEVQTVPLKMTKMFNQAINFLHEVCGCTIVLCSATQPDSQQTDCPIRIAEQGELVLLTEEEKKVFARTHIVDETQQQLDASELADSIFTRCGERGSVLAICNTKREAEALFSNLSHSCKAAGIALYHLSAAMCKRHREEVLAKIKAALGQRERVICVSTQVVEAGVDFSFACVYRVLAGVDNVMQAAGRCNRHGEFGHQCNVYLVRWKGEELPFLKEIELAQDAAIHTLMDGEDLLSKEGVQRYYFYLYADGSNGVDRLAYPIPKQHETMYKLLSGWGNGLVVAIRKIPPNVNVCLNHSFRTAAEQFNVFDENTAAVLVPYQEEGKRLLQDLQSERAIADMVYRKSVLRQLKPYTVSLYANQVERLAKNGGLFHTADGAILILQEHFYDEHLGVVLDGKESIF